MTANAGKRTAIYTRVSTREQHPRTQLRELTAYSKQRGLRVLHELTDLESGAKEDRPNLGRLMDLARKRQVDVVLVWKFDRFARSTQQLLRALEEFRVLGIDFISYTENVDTSTPAGKVLFTMVASIAEFERELIRERVRAGLARAREDGKQIGRPALSADKLAELRSLKKKGLSVRAIAKIADLSVGVVAKYAPARKPHRQPKPRRRRS